MTVLATTKNTIIPPQSLNNCSIGQKPSPKPTLRL